MKTHTSLQMQITASSAILGKVSFVLEMSLQWVSFMSPALTIGNELRGTKQQQQ